MGEVERNPDRSPRPSDPRGFGPTSRSQAGAEGEEESLEPAKGHDGGQLLSDAAAGFEPSDRALLSAGELPWALRVIVLLAPLGLLIVVVTSLWILQLGVERSVVIQVAPELVPAQEFAVRTQLLDGALAPRTDVGVEVALLQRGTRTPVGTLETVGTSGVHQGTLQLPDLNQGAVHGPAQLEVLLTEPGRAPLRELVDVTLVDKPTGRAGIRVNSSSTLNYADDTSEHPKEIRIDLRPFSRTLAGFENEMLVRTSSPSGAPISCDVEVWLIDGEWDGHAVVQGGRGEPLRVAAGRTDAFGILHFSGTLTSLLVRFDVRVTLPVSPTAAPLPPESPTPPVAKLERQVRLVTFSGGVDLLTQPLIVDPGQEVEITARTLRGKRPVFIDGHGPGGTWISTARPQVGLAIVDKATMPSATSGLVQFEAYNFTNRPGEDTAVARVVVMTRQGSVATRRRDALLKVVQLQREALAAPRVEKHFDPAQELLWLDKLQGRLSAQNLVEGSESFVDTALVERWLIGTLPIDVYGPPLALSTRAREEDDLATRRIDLTLGVRGFAIAGSALLTAMAVFAMWRENKRFMSRMREVLGDEAELVSARRQQTLRGLFVVALLVVSSLLGVLLLEKLVWID